MATATKSKRLTQQQKQIRAEARAELRKRGVLPPIKPKMNRKKFCAEAKAELESENHMMYEFDIYLIWALTEMLCHKGSDFKLDAEAVGVARAIKLAARRMHWEQQQRIEGKTTYKLGDLYDAVKDIYEA